MADSIPVPLWVLWGRAACVVLSALGCVVHYNLKKQGRRKVVHAIKTFYVSVARANRLKRLGAAAGVVANTMKKIYGTKGQRIVIVSLMLSTVYFAVAFFLADGPSINWQSIEKRKKEIEISADPILFAKPEFARSKAQEEDCSVESNGGVSCVPRFDDPESMNIRALINGFDEKYRTLVTEDKAHTELMILTLWEGTYLDRGWLEVSSLIIFNVVLDLSGVLLVMKVADVIATKQELSAMVPSALSVVCGSAMLLTLSLYSYSLVDSGDRWGVAAILGLFFGIGSAFFSTAVSVQMFREFWNSRHSENGEKWFPLFLALSMLLAAVGCTIVIKESWRHLVHPHLPAISVHQPITWFFYLLAVGAGLPTLAGGSFVVAVVIFGALARGLLFPTLVYVRTVIRMPTPALITLTAAPAIVFQTLASTWTDIFRMFHLR